MTTFDRNEQAKVGIWRAGFALGLASQSDAAHGGRDRVSHAARSRDAAERGGQRILLWSRQLFS
jgi:hypothetical protein